jgi:hypothetical protein
MLVARFRSNGASDLRVSEDGAGMSCGPVTTGRGTVVVGDGAVLQAANTSVAERNIRRDMLFSGPMR